MFKSGCKIIAEIGTLHLKSYKSQMDATGRCVRAGADMVKTQVIDPKQAPWASNAQKKRYSRLYHDVKWWKRYFKNAQSLYAKPVFASFFDTYMMKRLLKSVPAVKIANRMLGDNHMFQIARASKKPVIISAQHNAIKFTSPNLHWAYIQPEYPLLDRRVKMPMFGPTFTGLSIHSKNLGVLAAAMVMGARFIEVHVQCPGAEGPDTEFALTLDELSKLVCIRDNLVCMPLLEDSFYGEEERKKNKKKEICECGQGLCPNTHSNQQGLTIAERFGVVPLGGVKISKKDVFDMQTYGDQLGTPIKKKGKGCCGRIKNNKRKCC